MTTTTTAQAATKLGVSIRTIQRRCAAGKLTATKDTRGRWIITLEDTVTLPPLTGWHADIKPAEAERSKMLAQLAEQVAQTAGNIPAEALAELTAIYREVALRHTDATWWQISAGRPLGPIVQRDFTAADKERLTALREQFR